MAVLCVRNRVWTQRARKLRSSEKASSKLSLVWRVLPLRLLLRTCVCVCNRFGRQRIDKSNAFIAFNRLPAPPPSVASAARALHSATQSPTQWLDAVSQDCADQRSSRHTTFFHR
jgi:hypothetical protein